MFIKKKILMLNTLKHLTMKNMPKALGISQKILS